MNGDLKKGTAEYRNAKKEKMQNWSLDKKIKHTKKKIKHFYDVVDGKVHVAFSGGKDSMVLRDIVLSMYPETPCVFCNTTNEHFEILSFIKTLPDIVWLQPKKTFVEIMKDEGFPLVSKDVSRGITDLRNPTEKNKATRNLRLTGITRAGRKAPSFKIAKKWLFLKDEKFNITDKCCNILKKEPMARYERENKTFGFVGTQISESRRRENNWTLYGCNIISEKTKKSRPLSIWNEQDMWAYIHKFNIPYCSIYDDTIDEETGEIIVEGEARTGCAYCAYGANLEKGKTNRFQRLQLRKPKQFEKMMNLENNGVRFEDALQKVGVKTRCENG